LEPTNHTLLFFFRGNEKGNKKEFFKQTLHRFICSHHNAICEKQKLQFSKKSQNPDALHKILYICVSPTPT
jgi:hypothetical protein